MGYHSQNGQDQIIEDLNKKLGINIGWFVEFGAKDGYTLSNTAHFMECGWSGVYVEADPALAESLKKNMSGNPKIHTVNAMVTAENINDILSKTPLPHDFDLLSIDIDGNDYWVWQAITYNPKIVCIEYNSNFLPTESMVLKYDPLHVYQNDKNYGASAFALYKLGKKKGYRLVIHITYLDMFFVREDLALNIPELDINKIWKTPQHPGHTDKFILVD